MYSLTVPLTFPSTILTGGETHITTTKSVLPTGSAAQPTEIGPKASAYEETEKMFKKSPTIRFFRA